MTPLRIWHRLWVASVRYWLPTRSIRDSRAYDLSSELSHALEDGRIDHRERAQLAPKCRKAITMLRAFVAGSGPVRKAAE